MALDLHNALAKNDSRTVLEAARNLELGAWTVLEHLTFPITLFRFADPLTEKPISDGFRQLLEFNGVLAIAGAASGGRVRLSGGSVCSTELKMVRPIRVIKKTLNSLLQTTDTFDRHSLEFNWMQEFQISNLSLFPDVDLGATRLDRAFEMDFFPAYSLGEIFVDGAQSAKEAQAIVRSVLEMCQVSLHTTHAKANFESYIEKVCRRLASIVQNSSDSDFYDHLYQKGATINGTKCRPLKVLLELCRSTPRLKSIVECQDPRTCHGDLIPEDILFSRYYGVTKLIDPNPQITDPLADFAKLQMSFELCYDLALRDLASVETKSDEAELFIQTRLANGFNRYKSIQASLRAWLPTIVDQLVPPGSLEPERYRSQPVKVMAALQALAIPIFHALQHKRPERAKYFFAKGHEMLETSIADSHILNSL